MFFTVINNSIPLLKYLIMSSLLFLEKDKGVLLYRVNFISHQIRGHLNALKLIWKYKIFLKHCFYLLELLENNVTQLRSNNIFCIFVYLSKLLKRDQSSLIGTAEIMILADFQRKLSNIWAISNKLYFVGKGCQKINAFGWVPLEKSYIRHFLRI